MSRKKPEWRGKTDDAMPPPTVRLRIFRDHGGACHLCGQKVGVGERWDADHVKALEDGGENRETNMAPTHAKCHRRKTSAENSRRAKADRAAMKHHGIKSASQSAFNSRFKKTLDGRVLDRTTGEQVWPK